MVTPVTGQGGGRRTEGEVSEESQEGGREQRKVKKKERNKGTEW